MTMQQRNENRQILEEASIWFVDFRFGEIDKGRRREFMQWLQRSPEHIRAYMEIAGAYAQLPGAGTVENIHVERLIEKTKSRTSVVTMESASDLPIARSTAHEAKRASRVPRRPLVLRVASIAALSAAMLVAAWITLTRAPVYATTTAEHRSIALDDGSRIELNARTKVRIDFTDNERRIELLEGQALFHVAKDSHRPFIVSGAGSQVRAVGTRFDVHLRRSGTTVTVLEGRVAIQPPTSWREVERRHATETNAHLTQKSSPLEITAGEQVIITRTTVAKPARANVAAATAWTQGELEFDETPLPDVVEEFNRYSRIPLVIDAPLLEDIRITGVYSFEDPTSFIRFLRGQQDLVVTETSSEIRIRHK